MFLTRSNTRMGLALALAAIDAPPMTEQEKAQQKSRIAAEYAKHKAPAMFSQGDMFKHTMRDKT
ncbi:hypothetical protein [Stenotrophomonas phage StenR_269]|nr:hypothetical protein [Stenotrophomonas phage StenR_269]